jgi:hypothetical protein
MADEHEATTNFEIHDRGGGDPLENRWARRTSLCVPGRLKVIWLRDPVGSAGPSRLDGL